MATCSKCGTDYTNRGGPSLECDCGRKVDFSRLSTEDQASARMLETMEKVVTLLRAQDIQGVCSIAFGIGAALAEMRKRASMSNNADVFMQARQATDDLYKLVSDALKAGWGA